MPNRTTKAAKGKPSAAAGAQSPEQRSKEQLEDHVVRLREELDREREERSYFQLERDKIHALWEISRRRLEEAEAELRNGVRERDEAEERHRVEITVYKQKLKHVLSEQHNAATEVKTAAVSSSSLLQSQNTAAELGLRGEVRDERTLSQETRLQEQNAVKELKLKHQVALMRLSHEHERRLQEMEQRFHRRLWTLMQTEEKRRRSAVGDVEEQTRSRLENLKEEHERVLRRGDEFFSQVQESQKEELNRWKEELKKQQQETQQWEKDFSAAQQENQRLTKELQEVELKLPELHRLLQEHERSREKLEKRRAQQKLVEQELRDLTLEHELLLQAFQKVQQERDELLRRQTESILDIQQRSGLKKTLLQRKLDALTETLKKKEAQLSAALSVCSVEPTARRDALNRLEEILESVESESSVPTV